MLKNFHCKYNRALICIVIILLLPFSLSGCVKVQPSGNNNDKKDSNSSHLLTMTSGANNVCVSDSGIYHTELGDSGNYSIIYYIDSDTLKEIPLCSSAGCKHEDDTCTAYIADSNPYIFASRTDDKIFIIYKTFLDGGYTTSIYSMMENGSDRKEICKLNNGESFSLSGVIAQYDDLIYIIKDVFSDGEMTEVLVRIDYKNHTATDICQFPENSKIIGADDDNLYICTEYFVGENRTTITKFNVKNSEEQRIIIFNTGNRSYFYSEGKVYRIESTEEFVVEEVNLDDGSCNVVYTNPNYKSDWSFSVLNTVDNYIIMSYVGTDTKIKHLAYDAENQNIYDLTLKITGDDQREAFVTILACTDDYYYVAMKSTLKEGLFMGNDGNYYTGNNTVLEKRLIAKNDYFNNIENYKVINTET